MVGWCEGVKWRKCQRCFKMSANDCVDSGLYADADGL